MYGLYPGFLYPGLYGYGLEVPVPPTRPPTLCLTSGVSVLYLLSAGVECRLRAASGGVYVTYSVTAPPESTVLVVACDIDVRGAIRYETLTCRGFVTSGVSIRYAEVDVTEDQPTVCAEVAVRYLSQAALDCTSTGVLSGVSVRTTVTAGVAFCCVGCKPCE